MRNSIWALTDDEQKLLSAMINEGIDNRLTNANPNRRNELQRAMMVRRKLEKQNFIPKTPKPGM